MGTHKAPPVYHTLTDDEREDRNDDAKYRMLEFYFIAQSGIKGLFIDTVDGTLHPDGRLFVKADFYWDGPSGPTVDTDDTMGPSAGHDLLYKWLKLGLLAEKMRRKVDKMYKQLLRKSGTSYLRRSAHFLGVRVLGWAYV